MARTTHDIENDIRSIFGDDEDTLSELISSNNNDRSGTSLSSTSSTFEDTSSSSSSDDTENDDEEMETNEVPEPNWTEEPPTKDNLNFLGNQHINIDNAVDKSPLDYFNVFFNPIFISKLTSWTNRHAVKVLARPRKPKSRLNNWKETNETELMTFIGILFFMGTVRINKINDYLKKHHLYKFSLGRYMSRNRFLLILRMLYFTNDEVTSVNRYSAVDDLFSYFNSRMKEIYYPGKQFVIDESMVSFRGRLGIRQYIKNKRHKFGIKLYVLANPQGLVLKVLMYRGSTDQNVGGQGHVDKVVMKLLENYLDKGHSLYIDNFYGSVNLAEKLLSKNTYCTGTLQSNRKNNPSLVVSKRLKKGESVYRYNRNGVCVLKWKDKRDVLVLSTEHNHRSSQVTNRRGNNILKPNIVLQYNKYMKGVDRHDQMMSYFPCEHKTVRWFKKIGIHLLQTMMTNAFFLYRQGTRQNISLSEFRTQVIDAILPPKENKRKPPPHMPIPLPRNADGIVLRRKCARCKSQRNRRTDTGMFCPDCNLGLCLPCYAIHHLEISIEDEID